MKHRLSIGILAVATSLASPLTAAGDNPENTIKYRQAVMKALAGHMGASAQIVRGKVALTDRLAHHASAISALSNGLGELFPEGSDFGETRALEAIWEQSEEFARLIGEAETAAGNFQEAVAAGDPAALGKSFKGLAESCKGCHKEYREEE